MQMTEYEFEIEQGGSMQAGGTVASPEFALAEAAHYEAMYGQDGPVTVRFWRKQLLTRDEMRELADGCAL